MTRKTEIINALYTLYRLREEGKNVQVQINELEKELCKVCEEQEYDRIDETID